jgi:hypothetical protein
LDGSGRGLKPQSPNHLEEPCSQETMCRCVAYLIFQSLVVIICPAILTICNDVFYIYWFCVLLNVNSINQLIFVMVKCGVLFEVRTEFLNII